MRLIDLTHTFDETIPLYPGDPVPEIRKLAELSGTGYMLSGVCTGMHAGTHMDAPLHMIAGDKCISELPVEKFIGRGVIIDARNRKKIDAGLLEGVNPGRGDIVLVLTGFSAKLREPAYFLDHPQVTLSFAKILVEAGISILGLDTPGPDRAPFTVHRRLLSGGVLIVENLTNLESLVGVREFEVFALPAKYKTEAAPVRVIARVIEDS